LSCRQLLSVRPIAGVKYLCSTERMIRLSGHKPGTDIEIEITGVRPGEKLAEELIALDEAQEETAHVSIQRVVPIPIGDERLEKGVLQLGHLVIDLADEECREQLRALALVERQAHSHSIDLAAD